jgi:hypothetical protein
MPQCGFHVKAVSIMLANTPSYSYSFPPVASGLQHTTLQAALFPSIHRYIIKTGYFKSIVQ